MRHREIIYEVGVWREILEALAICQEFAGVVTGPVTPPPQIIALSKNLLIL